MMRACVSGLFVFAFAFTAAWTSRLPAKERPVEGKQVLLIGQDPDGHARMAHEYMAGMRILAECLKGVEGLRTQVVYGREPWPDGPELIRDCDAVVLFLSQGARWMQAAPRRYQALTKLASRGGGIGAIHWAVGAKDGGYRQGQIKLLGASRGGKHRPYGHFTARLSPATSNHPVVRGIQPFEIHDEFYYQLEFVQPMDGVKPLITARINDREAVVAWSWERPGGGRSFGFTGLHYHKNWQRAEYRRLVANATAWMVGLDLPADGLPVDLDNDVLRLRDSDREPPKD